MHEKKQTYNTAPIELREMTVADIPDGMILKQAAGWNQIPEDWEMILHASKGGNYVAICEGTIVGTITTITYQDIFSWLGMLLVAPAHRNKGIGTQLFKAALGFARNLGAVRLDARPVGQPLYSKLGFVDEGLLVRMLRKRDYDYPETSDDVSLRQLNPEILNSVFNYDEFIFGADRRLILSDLFARTPYYGFFAERTTKSIALSPIAGYCLGRPGSHYNQIGPIVADTISTAQQLLLSSLKVNTHKDVIIDVPAQQYNWITWLEKIGFTKQHTYIRMVFESLCIFGQLEKQYAIAGPELG